MDDEYFPQTEKPPLKGVGGWLLLFCMGQVILSPIRVMDEIGKVWERLGPHPFPVIKQLVVIDIIVMLLVLAYGMTVGVLIWKGNRHGRTLARRYLLIRVIVAVLVCTLTIAWAYHSFSSVAAKWMAAAVVPGTALEIASCLLWWCYFTYSKRVWNTYCATGE